VLNPLRSERDAFRLVVGAVGYFAAIALAAKAGGFWPGIVVFALLSVAIVAWWLRARREEAPVPAARTRPTPEGERRILVVANETVAGTTLRDCIRKKTEGVQEHVFVVTPALNSPLRHWASDHDDARTAAQQRLDESLARLREVGIDARGEVGDGDPLQAMEDALRTFGADEIIISTHPEGRSHWLERDIVATARRRFAVPITHVVVDLETASEEIR
jgi:hypothetical protein